MAGKAISSQVYDAIGRQQGVAFDGRLFPSKRYQMNKKKLESAKNLFFIALGLDIAVTLFVVVSDFWGAGVLKDIGAGRITADQSTINSLEFWDSFAKLILLTMLGVGLGLVKWLNSCYIYAKESIGASGFKNEGWTTGGWIIPIFNLFKPYQVINEIYKAGSPTYAVPDGWKKVGGSGLLLAWWIFWAVTHFIGWIVVKQMFKSAMRDDMTLQQSIGAIEFHAWFCMVFLVVSGLWFVVANELTSRLLERKTIEDSSLLRGHSAAVASQALVTPKMPKQPVIGPLNDGLQMRTTDFHSVGALGGEAAPTVLPTIITPSGSTMNTESSTEEDHWAEAMAEVESGQRRPGVWAKAFAESEGDETKAKVAYLKARVQQLTDAVKALKAKEEAEKQEEIMKALAAARADEAAFEQSIKQFLTSGTVSLSQISRLVQHPDKARIVQLTDSIRGNTLLHICAESDMVEEVNALLLAGADPQLSNNNGVRPEFLSKNAFVSELIREGALPSEKVRRVQELSIGFDGRAFTFEGFRCDHIDDAIAHVEKARGVPDALLLLNVIDGNLRSVKSRLELGIEPTGLDSKGKTLLDHAKASNDKLMIALLELHGA